MRLQCIRHIPVEYSGANLSSQTSITAALSVVWPCLQLGQHPVLKDYVDRISRETFERPVPTGAASMSQEWSQRARAAAKGPR